MWLVGLTFYRELKPLTIHTNDSLTQAVKPQFFTSYQYNWSMNVGLWVVLPDFLICEYRFWL